MRSCAWDHRVGKRCSASPPGAPVSIRQVSTAGPRSKPAHAATAAHPIANPLKESTLQNLQPGRRTRVAGALIAVVALMTALFAVTSVASNADVPATGVTTVATTPYQSGINPNTTTLTGLKNGD